jgi:hypothetical protein
MIVFYSEKCATDVTVTSPVVLPPTSNSTATSRYDRVSVSVALKFSAFAVRSVKAFHGVCIRRKNCFNGSRLQYKRV